MLAQAVDSRRYSRLQSTARLIAFPCLRCKSRSAQRILALATLLTNDAGRNVVGPKWGMAGTFQSFERAAN